MNIIVRDGLIFVLGVAVSAIVNHFLAKDRDRQIHKINMFSNAALRFKDAFAAELAFLVSDTKPQSSIHGTNYDILGKALNKHRHAVDVFGGVLKKRKRKS